MGFIPLFNKVQTSKAMFSHRVKKFYNSAVRQQTGAQNNP
jgi:hypothetical protein